jgi:hypothetical protein
MEIGYGLEWCQWQFGVEILKEGQVIFRGITA